MRGDLVVGLNGKVFRNGGMAGYQLLLLVKVGREYSYPQTLLPRKPMGSLQKHT